MRSPWRWPMRALLALGVLLLLFWASGCAGMLRAASLLSDAQRPAHELAGEVEEWEERIDGIDVMLYRALDRTDPSPALVLVHGAVDTGAREPRLVALARALAMRDVLVACPDLPSLKAFSADPRDPLRLVRIARAVADRTEATGEVALLGISIGGSYCLVAAAHPDLRGRTSAVMAFGGYEDLGRLVTGWMVDPEPDVPELYDPLVTGRRLVLLGNLESLVPAEDHAAARAALEALVRGDEPPPDAARDLSPAGQEVLACAVSVEPIASDLAESVLAPVENELRALSPGHDGTVPEAPVFLLHGESDPIVPATDAPLLAKTLRSHGARVRVHVTEVFSHVGAEDDASILGTWSLLRFVALFLKAAGI